MDERMERIVKELETSMYIKLAFIDNDNIEQVAESIIQSDEFKLIFKTFKEKLISCIFKSPFYAPDFEIEFAIPLVKITSIVINRYRKCLVSVSKLAVINDVMDILSSLEIPMNINHKREKCVDTLRDSEAYINFIIRNHNHMTDAVFENTMMSVVASYNL